MPFSSFTKVEWWMLLAAALAAAAAWATWRAYHDAARWVTRTADTRRQLILLARDVQQAQRGQRGYLLTGRAE